MSTTRRGFLKMLGLGAAAVAVGPTVMGMIPKVDAVTKVRKFTDPADLNALMNQMGRRMQEDILRRLSATNPFMELIDGEKRPLSWYVEEQSRDRAEVAEYHRSEAEEMWAGRPLGI